ncbi:hypothetical protein [Peribacillus frigoritolerans]|uniref:hypothetical protein n=1 Tax=Peribacillus frigoritolerans TaxID=450367 RepID=UPI0007BF7E58|nr:hypothetical protein [Peribacillus frigoritolerans]
MGFLLVLFLSPPKELTTSNIDVIEKEREVTNAAADFGTVGYGVGKLKSKVIDEGSILNSTDNEVSVVASVDNHIDEVRKYALLVFEDYK